MEIALLSANQMSFLSVADAFLARRRWTSPPHQGKGRQPKWRPRLISLSTVACFVWHPRGVQIWYLFSPLTLAQHLNRKLDTSRGFAVHVLWTGRSCLDALLLSRLMSIPERLKWWRLQPGMSSYEFIIVHQPNLSTSSLYQTYKNTNAFLASARVHVRIALHKCSRKSWQSWCSVSEAQRDGIRAGAAGESSDVVEVHWTNSSFERSPLYEFLLQPSPRVDFHLVLNTCPFFSSIQYSDFKNRPIFTNHKFQWFRFLPIEPPMFMIFTFDSCCCANQSGHFRCVSSSVLIVGSSCTDSTDGLFCHEQCNPVRLFPVETSDRFWNPGSCMDI